MTIFAAIKERLSVRDLIESVTSVNNRGFASCPFHEDRTPSLQVNEEKGLWHCFGCGEGGDIFSFAEKFYGVSRGEALKMFSEKTGIDLQSGRLDPAISKEVQENRDRRDRRNLFDLWRDTTWRNLVNIYRSFNRITRMPLPKGFTEGAWLDVLGPLYNDITYAEAGLTVFEGGTLDDQLKYFMEQKI